MSGAIRIEVYDREGDVVIDFDRQTERVVFNPQLAVQVAKSMIDAAAECGFEITIQVPRREISELTRNTLITRVNHIMRSLQDKQKDNPFIAAQIVDTVLSEVA